MAQADAIQICSEALILIGEAPIESFEGVTAAHQAANAHYLPNVAGLLASHPWRFNRQIVQLARLAGDPPMATGYSAAYALPVGMLRLIVPFVNGKAVDGWEPSETVVWLDAELADRVELEYHGMVDELRFSPQFRQALVHHLASVFAVPIRDDARMMDLQRQASAEWLAKARHQNATERPARQMPTGRFAALRRQ